VINGGHGSAKPKKNAQLSKVPQILSKPRNVTSTQTIEVKGVNRVCKMPVTRQLSIAAKHILEVLQYQGQQGERCNFFGLLLVLWQLHELQYAPRKDKIMILHNKSSSLALNHHPLQNLTQTTNKFINVFVRLRGFPSYPSTTFPQYCSDTSPVRYP
jgi:hypothetical protein